MDKSAFTEDYLRGLESLYLHSPTLFYLVRALGTPQANGSIPTAQVSFDPATQRVLFEMNPDFIAPLSDEQVAFVVTHEAYHVLLEHLAESMDHVSYPQDQILVVAHECIVNDTVQGFGLDHPGDIHLGSLYGANFSHWTTREGYDFLASLAAAQGDQGGSGQDGDSAGDAGPQFPAPGDAQACGGLHVPEGHRDDFLRSVGGSLVDAMGKMAGEGEQLDDDFMDLIHDLGEATGHGMGTLGNPADMGSLFANPVDGMSLDWKRVVSLINPKVLSAGHPNYKPSFHAPRRRLTSIYPKVVVPNQRRARDDDGGDGMSKPTLILALDVSPSIPRHLIGNLVALAHSVPEKHMHCVPVTWSSSLMEYDPEEGKMVNPVGTDVEVVWDYAQKVAKANRGRQPYVLVVTDGGTMFPANRVERDVVQRHWFWAGIQNGDTHTILRSFSDYTNADQVFRLTDLLG